MNYGYNLYQDTSFKNMFHRCHNSFVYFFFFTIIKYRIIIIINFVFADKSFELKTVFIILNVKLVRIKTR